MKTKTAAARIASGADRRWFWRGAAGLALLAAGMAPAEAGRVNFAKYQAAAASGQTSTYHPDFAFDGIAGNLHSFRTNNTNDPHWLEVDFPRPVTIGSAHVYPGRDGDPALGGLPTFRFHYHDGTGWVDVPGSAVTGNTATERAVIFGTAITSDRFRLYTDENGSRTIRELALFPPNLVGGVEQGYAIGTDVRLSLAYQRPAAGSTISAGGYPKLAVDGYVDDASRWLCANASGQTLEIDLLDTHVLGSAHVYSGTGTTAPLANFTLQSWDGTAWTDLPGATVTGNTATARVVPFSTNVATSRIRLLTTSASNGRVRELLVFPPRPGGYPLGQDVETGSPPAARWDDFSDSSWKLDNSGPDLRLGLVNGAVVFAGNAASPAVLDWQLLLNHRDGSYRVRHTATGDCLALANISSASGPPVVAAAYTGLPHQDWFLDFVDATQFRLVNAYSGLALNSVGFSWNAGTAIMVAPPGPGALQRWTRTYSTHHPKKGIAATTRPVPGSPVNYFEDAYNKYGGSWSYSWGRQDSRLFPFIPAHHTFNPMQWGNGTTNWIHGTPRGPLEVIRNDLQSNPKPAHLMGYNEPDREDQGFTAVAAAIARWPRLEAMDAPLVAPGPADTFGDWLPDWTAKADACGLRRDYTPYHWYAPPDADQIIADLNRAFTTYGHPVWLTEFSAISWSGSGSWTDADNYHFPAEFMWRAESLPWLKRYALYQFVEGGAGGTDAPAAPRSNARRADNTLTAFGELYAGWDGVTTVLPGKAYHLHNRGACRRIVNPATGADVVSGNPETSAAGSQWFLTPGLTEGTHKLVSTRDGRVLRWYSGVPVSLAVASQTATFVEWRWVPDQHGWYFIEHPASNQRLRDNGDGTPGMGAITGAGDAFKWRFVVPALSEPAAPPAAPASVVAVASLTEIALSWPDVPGAVSYTVHRSATTGGPWQPMGSATAATAWSDSGLPWETRYFYTVTASNALGNSLPSSEVSAVTLHPFATYAAWAQQTLGAAPAPDRAEAADPDSDRFSNLLEFAFLTNPTRPGGSPFLISRTQSGSVILEFPWNRRANGFRWQIRHGQDLANRAARTLVDPGTPTVTREGDIDRIRVSPAPLIPHRGFFVLEVLEN